MDDVVFLSCDHLYGADELYSAGKSVDTVCHQDQVIKRKTGWDFYFFLEWVWPESES